MIRIIKTIYSIIMDYGCLWLMYRFTYNCKIWLLKNVSFMECLFEKNMPDVRRLEIFKINAKAIELFLTRIPDKKKKEIINIATNAINGKINGFSSMELDYGNPINWHLNPLTAKSVRYSAKWFDIPDFDSDIGDIKVIWEASRFTHFYFFARAFMITRDIKYYCAFSKQLDDWLLKNEYSFGANYKCGQECALRMINTHMAYAIFSNYGLITEKDSANLAKLTEVSYRKILSNFFYAHKCIKNNHTLSELAGLIIGAWCCCDTKQLKSAYALLDDVICEQFTADGGYVQHSFNYQRFAMQICECILSLSKTTQTTLNEAALNRLANSALLIYQCQSEDGRVPNYGSNDGALIFPVTTCGYEDYRPVVKSLFALIKNRSLLPEGLYDEEMLWFGAESDGGIAIKKESHAYTEAGIYTLFNGNYRLLIHLNLYHSRPAHMDQLHIDLWYKNINILCDSGTYSYALPEGRKLALTAAHNVVFVNNEEQMSKKEPFLIYNWTQKCYSELTQDVFKGAFRSSHGYFHERVIEKITSGFIVHDTIKSEKPGYADVLFHTPCPVYIEKNIAFVTQDDKILCKLQTANGCFVLNKSYCSRYYLRLEEIYCLTVRLPLVNKRCTNITTVDFVA